MSAAPHRPSGASGRHSQHAEGFRPHRLGVSAALVLLLLGCSSTKPRPHEHSPKWLIKQGVEDSLGVAHYGWWYACCECGAELRLNEQEYEALMREQGEER